MPLQSTSDLKASSRLSIVKNHDNTYIRDGLKSLELQSKWITLSKYPLPNKKYLKELDSSITLSVPIDEQNELYAFFNTLTNLLKVKIYALIKSKTNLSNRRRTPKGPHLQVWTPKGPRQKSGTSIFQK